MSKVTFRNKSVSQTDNEPQAELAVSVQPVHAPETLDGQAEREQELQDSKSNFKQAVKEIFSVAEPPAAVEEPELFEVLPPQVIESVVIAQETDLPSVTYIAPGTVIHGSISVSADVEIYGRVEGSVECGNDLTLNGRVDGDVSAENLALINATVIGDINVKQAVSARGAVLIKGGVAADNIDFFGKIKGNISAGNTLIIRKDSIVIGDVSSQSLYVELGAVVQGRVNVITEMMSELEELE